MNYHITNILEMLEDESGKYSEERESDVRNLIDSFSCPLNAEIEYFLHHNAIEFAKRKQCITYFVRDFNGELVAYYALTHKAVEINASHLSKTVNRGIASHAEQSLDTGIFNASAFLLAQFGKNGAYNGELNISGSDLMNCVLDSLCAAQHLVGGGIVYLECEDAPKLIAFCTSDTNRFREFGTRESKSENITYRQFLCLF